MLWEIQCVKYSAPRLLTSFQISFSCAVASQRHQSGSMMTTTQRTTIRCKPCILLKNAKRAFMLPLCAKAYKINKITGFLTKIRFLLRFYKGWEGLEAIKLQYPLWSISSIHCLFNSFSKIPPYITQPLPQSIHMRSMPQFQHNQH